jgi:hypothetical protein
MTTSVSSGGRLAMGHRKRGRKRPRVDADLGIKGNAAIAVVGIALVVASALLGKDDWATELPYDLGIACLIVVGVEIGLQRGLARIPHAVGDLIQRILLQSTTDALLQRTDHQ